MLKKMILTSKQHAELPFAGQNTQQLLSFQHNFMGNCAVNYSLNSNIYVIWR